MSAYARYVMSVRIGLLLLFRLLGTWAQNPPTPSTVIPLQFELTNENGWLTASALTPPVLEVLEEDFKNDPERAFFFANATFDVKASNNDRRNRIGYATEYFSNESVIGAFGYERECRRVVPIAESFNKLIGSANCEDLVTGPEARTFLQLKPSARVYLRALVATLNKMQFDRVALIYGSRTDSVNENAIRNIVTEELLKGRINVISEDPLGSTTNQKGELSPFASIIRKTYLKTRCYVILLDQPDQFVSMYYVMLETMSRMSLLQTSQYMVVVYFGEEIFSTVYSWRTEKEYPMFTTFTNYDTTRIIYAARMRTSLAAWPYRIYRPLNLGFIYEGMRNSLLITPAFPAYDNYKKFQERMSGYGNKPKCPPICHPSVSEMQGYRNNAVRSFFQMRFYDMMTFVTKTAARLLKQGRDITNGAVMFESLINSEFVGVDGNKVFIDQFGKAKKNQWLNVFQRPPNKTNRAHLKSGEIRYSSNAQFPTLVFDKDFQGFDWIGGIRPTNQPTCGYDGTLCRSVSNTISIIVGSVMAGVVIILLVIVGLIARRWRYEKSLMSMLWKVERKNLILKKARQLGSGSIHSVRSSVATIGNSNGDMRKSHFSLKDWEAAMIREARREEAQKQAQANPKKKRAFGNPEEEKWLNLPDYSMALYNGQLVGLKKIYKTHVDLTRTTRKELKELMNLSHDNLNPFIGAVHEPPHVFLVSEICLRGSLKDTLENDEIKLDDVFINSIVFDIIKGLSHLHKSSIKAHGRLKSSNCLIDSRWVVRLSSFGLHDFRIGENISEEDEVDEEKALLWTAPELLRNKSDQTAFLAMQKGDIYSLGIILYEIFGRQGPYGEELLEPREIIEMVKFNKSGTPTRPNLSIVEGAPDFVRTTMEACWQENPWDRPSIQKVQFALKPLQKGLKSNIMDNMISLMERYTNNLEEVVSERTQQLDDERKKSERLLLMMLPQTVAETLKKGQLVEAEFYEHVSIYFSDIVGFTSMSSASTPIQVVNFLNDLYTAFDTVISHYDVYKVETIGDAYMVVSGLPDRNGLNHAGEIASMSLQLLECVKRFKIRHRPDDTLKLRIGIHSGSVVAGVVGLRMPRYCLFGDTVNTASRMESNGEALKIHCSGECRAILEEIGGYDTEERGYVAMKGKGEQLTYWVIEEHFGTRLERLREDIEKYPHLQRVLNF